MFHSLPTHIHTYLFFHNGPHVYIQLAQNWLPWVHKCLIDQEITRTGNSLFQLPTVLWRQYSAPQLVISLDNRCGQENWNLLSLGQEEQAIQNQYPDKDFERYGKTYQTFNTELYRESQSDYTINLPVTRSPPKRSRSAQSSYQIPSTNKGLLSPQLLEFGQKKYLILSTAIKSAIHWQRGRYHMLKNLWIAI